MKNQAAVELGRLGGKTTGPTKARDPAKMRAAALKRWGNRNVIVKLKPLSIEPSKILIREPIYGGLLKK